MRFLAKVIAAAGTNSSATYRAAFLHGLDYIFASQYPNGGWPQVWPLQGGYHDAITYNDNAIINVLALLRDISETNSAFAFVPENYCAPGNAGLQRGIACILATQIIVNGRMRSGFAFVPGRRKLFGFFGEVFDGLGEGSLGLLIFDLVELLELPFRFLPGFLRGAGTFGKIKPGRRNGSIHTVLAKWTALAVLTGSQKMKKTVYTILGTVLLCLQHANAQPTTRTNDYHRWWQDRPFGPPFKSSQTNQLPLIRVQGNKFVDPDGKTVLFRGLAISDPDKLEHQGHWNKNHFEKVKEMGATLVRIPVHPVAWRERTPREYLKLLDQAVDWCTELDMHVIIDWHSIGNLQMQLFQDPMYETTQQETFEFWRTMAQHFKGTHTIAFYELFNEPALYRGQLGSMSWSEWKKLNENMIRLIRAFDTEKIPLVAGLDWAYDLTPLNIEPLEAEGIGYVTHPYANKRPKPWEPKWEEDFGFAAGRYPVIATEFGFSVPKGTALKDDDYGNLIINYLEGKGISWMVWCFDPEWGPRLLASWDYDLTGSGEFFKQAMHRKAGN